MRRFVPLLLALSLVLGSCREGGAQEPAPKQAVPAADAPCAEHGVTQAVCSKCNPKLAAIFQEKGDWCAEHGFPESFCPVCHPERGGKPTADLSSDGAPLDGTQVVLRTPEAIRAAGIEVAHAREPDAGATLSVLASIVYDAPRRAEINPRLEGIVREVLVDVGAKVAEGTPLFRIESAAVGAELSRVSSARTRLRVAEAAQKRFESLLENGMAAQRDLLEVELELDMARAEIAAATGTLGLVEIDAGATNRYSLLAPIDGTVTLVSAAAGRMVDAEDVLCEIVDTSSMWAELSVPEAELGRIALGLRVSVHVDALPQHVFEGRVDYIAPEIDPRTRTAKVRARLANEAGMLRANMYARATIALGPSTARALVPLDALQRAEGVELLFVQLASDSYETRRVKVGARRGLEVEVLQGVEPGELVATRGSFLLKTETLKGSIGAGCCDFD